MRYTVVKSTRSGWLIDDGSGTSIRYPTKAEAERIIARWERVEAEAEIMKLERHAARLAAVKEYLTARSARAETAKQLDFVF